MKHSTKIEREAKSMLEIFYFLFRGIKNIFKFIKSIFVPPILVTLGKINDLQSCGLKYKFKYYYNLDEILSKEYPQGMIGQMIHRYIYQVLNKEIKFDQEYILEMIMTRIEDKYKDLTNEDKNFHIKNTKKMLENFYNWYSENKYEVVSINYDIFVNYNKVKFKIKCDCILKDKNGDYIVIDFMTSKKNLSSEFLTYDFDTNYQYFVLEKFFTKKQKNFKLIKFFLPYNNFVEFKPDWAQQKETEKIVFDLLDQLKNKEFEIKKGPICGWCGYYDICPAWKLEREGDKEENIPAVAKETTLFRQARETKGRMALSYSKMSMYIQCPRRYRLCYLDKKGVKPQGFFSIGSTIHNALELFYQIKTKNNKEPGIDELLKLYDECWISAGYKTPQEEKEYYLNGKQWLVNYYEKFVKDKFITAYATEEYFELPIGKNTHVMIGYIDRIQKNPDGTFEILDYKTDPKLRSQQEVDSDLQLTIYYWALRNRGIETKRLGLIFIRFGEIVYTTRTQKDIDILDDYVKEVADKMWADGEKYMNLIKEYEEKNQVVPEEKIEEVLPSKINKYCGGCDYLKGCPKEEIIKTEYKDKLLFEVSDKGEVLDKEIDIKEEEPKEE
ncbi:MAG: PD-(D/E)XK nuclease family protein [Endomicrobiia bacterium]